MQSFKSIYALLDSKQINIIRNCYASLIPAQLSLSKDQIKTSKYEMDDGFSKISITTLQMNIIEKSKLLNISCVLELNLHQMKEMDINQDIDVKQSDIIGACRKYQTSKRVFKL